MKVWGTPGPILEKRANSVPGSAGALQETEIEDVVAAAAVVAPIQARAVKPIQPRRAGGLFGGMGAASRSAGPGPLRAALSNDTGSGKAASTLQVPISAAEPPVLAAQLGEDSAAGAAAGAPAAAPVREGAGGHQGPAPELQTDSTFAAAPAAAGDVRPSVSQAQQRPAAGSAFVAAMLSGTKRISPEVSTPVCPPQECA